MASKKYAYFNKGNKIGIVQQDTTNSTSSDYGMYKSPVDSTTKTLEIEYSYSPNYRIFSDPTPDVNKFYINAWTVVDGYLTFLRSLPNQNIWNTAPYTNVTAGSQGDAGGQVRDYIVVGGTSQWNGVHRVKAAGAQYHGSLQTYTRVDSNYRYITGKQIDFTAATGVDAADEIFDGGSGDVFMANLFSIGQYIFIEGSENGLNNGLFKISSKTDSTKPASSKIAVDKYYSVGDPSQDLDASGSPDSYEVEHEFASPINSRSVDTSVNIYEANRDFGYILTDVKYMNDESYEIDLTRYQSNAIVHYLRAKNAEDVGDIERYEYYMRAFRKQTEKGDESRKYGVRMAQGFWGMRK